jgi:hypothetical protein
MNLKIPVVNWYGFGTGICSFRCGSKFGTGIRDLDTKTSLDPMVLHDGSDLSEKRLYSAQSYLNRSSILLIPTKQKLYSA